MNVVKVVGGFSSRGRFALCRNLRTLFRYGLERSLLCTNAEVRLFWVHVKMGAEFLSVSSDCKERSYELSWGGNIRKNQSCHLDIMAPKKIKIIPLTEDPGACRFKFFWLSEAYSCL